eukprot:m.86521 g.86521  ORF g.86521 m.86521 type:complete len:400 (-) comp25976_c0_seq1:76-1275(-)
MDRFSDRTAKRRVHSQESLHTSAGILHKVITDVRVSGLDKKSAEIMLVSVMEEGSFIIRGGQDNCGYFTLSMCFLRNDQLVVLHMMIVIESDFDTGNTWYWISRQPRDSDTFDEESRNALRFNTLEELRAYYKTSQGTVHHGGVLPTRLTKELNPRDIDATTMEELTLQMSPPLSRAEQKTHKNSQKLRAQWEKEKSKGSKQTSQNQNGTKSPGLMRRLGSLSFVKKKLSPSKSNSDNDTINIKFDTDSDRRVVEANHPDADDTDDENYVDTESDIAEAIEYANTTMGNTAAMISTMKSPTIAETTRMENTLPPTPENITTKDTTIENATTEDTPIESTTTKDTTTKNSTMENSTTENALIVDATIDDMRVASLTSEASLTSVAPLTSGDTETGYVCLT